MQKFLDDWNVLYEQTFRKSVAKGGGSEENKCKSKDTRKRMT